MRCVPEERTGRMGAALGGPPFRAGFFVLNEYLGGDTSTIKK